LNAWNLERRQRRHLARDRRAGGSAWSVQVSQ